MGFRFATIFSLRLARLDKTPHRRTSQHPNPVCAALYTSRHRCVPTTSSSKLLSPGICHHAIGMICVIPIIGISGMIGMRYLMRVIGFRPVSGPRRDCSQQNDNETVVGERWNLGTDSSSVAEGRRARSGALGLPPGLARLARLGAAPPRRDTPLQGAKTPSTSGR
jgi:hypothetical protein